MAMSRKHYEGLAQIMRRHHDRILEWFGTAGDEMSLFNDQLTETIEFLKTDNPQFNADTFIEAATGFRLHVQMGRVGSRWYIERIEPADVDAAAAYVRAWVGGEVVND